MRALDYLETRSDVDKTKFGVTGRSGGGAYSWWIAALDERIKVAVPTAGITDLVYFIRVGTLDTPARFPPDVHIHTSTKQPWLELPPSVQAVAEYYDTDTTWSAGSLVRRMALKAIIEQQMEDAVYWFDVSTRTPRRVTLHAAPVFEALCS